MNTEIELINEKITELEFKCSENLRKIENLRDSNTYRDTIIHLFLEGKISEAIEKYNVFMDVRHLIQ